MKDFAIHLGSLRAVHTGGSPAENNSLGSKVFHLFRGNGVRNDFRVDVSLPNPAGNDLGVLRAEIQNQNPVDATLGGTETSCLQEHYFTDSAKIVKPDRGGIHRAPETSCGAA